MSTPVSDSASGKSIEKGDASVFESSVDSLDPEVVARAWRKVDWHVMPVAAILYLSSYIDRANIGNAKVLGMYKQLHLTDNQYSLALSIFFLGYVVFEVPSNIVVKKVGPAWYIPIMTMLWGGICALTSLVHSASGLATVRFFLGLTEAGFLPGIIFWIGSWYPRPLQGRRYAILYSSASLTGAFGGLLATAIHTLDGVHGIAGWRWIYIVEGVITAGLGIVSFIFLSSDAATAKWLTEEERRAILLINESDRALKAKESFSGRQIKSAFTDWRIYLWGFMYITNYIPVYSVVLGLPTVITGLGYKGTSATLMSVPPYGLGFIIVLIAGWTTDKYGYKIIHYLVGITVVGIALIVLMITTNLVARYVMFFLVMFMFIPVSTMWAWIAQNIAGSNKRAAATGFIFSMGNIGGAISGQIYRAEWAPRYVESHAINFGCYVLAFISGVIMWWSYRRDNQLRDKAAGRIVEKGDMLGEDLGELGDRHPSFRYYL
ncbi:MFS general substrate transporter [Irpex rosettiformis]|uniref:MFS general substrate transporter n=1 Tax=Irpex rosettiformis TaxID=378272 RepID=A0ACB8TXP7_9APHY|nr:MFS general substrate transporter [Irpex rosettiformis]